MLPLKGALNIKITPLCFFQKCFMLFLCFFPFISPSIVYSVQHIVTRSSSILNHLKENLSCSRFLEKIKLAASDRSKHPKAPFKDVQFPRMEGKFTELLI